MYLSLNLTLRTVGFCILAHIVFFKDLLSITASLKPFLLLLVGLATSLFVLPLYCVYIFLKAPKTLCCTYLFTSVSLLGSELLNIELAFSIFVFCNTKYLAHFLTNMDIL